MRSPVWRRLPIDHLFDQGYISFTLWDSLAGDFRWSDVSEKLSITNGSASDEEFDERLFTERHEMFAKRAVVGDGVPSRLRQTSYLT
jgi:hypothetical protein